MRVAICGAGIAGGTLAYWLLRAGHDVLLIEHAPSLRTGGYLMDFWGVGYSVAERMGILPEVLKAGYQVKAVSIRDDANREVGGFAVEALRDLTQGRITSVARGDLAAAIYRSIAGRVETVFGDSVAGIAEHASGVRLTLDSGQTRDVDLVAGADGLHSRVRALTFGDEHLHEKDLGYRVAAFECRGYARRDELTYVVHAATSRQVARFALRDDRTLFLLVFRAALMDGSEPGGIAETRAVLRSVHAGAGWETPAILSAMDAAEDIYFDRVSQIRMPSWHKGRIVLVGDAGMAVSLLAGEGAGLGMAGAYVLASELRRCSGDWREAFGAYERRLRPFIEGKQRAAEKFASTFVPQSRFGIWVRNQATRLMALPGMANLLLGRSLRDDLELPDDA
jgi:2-polyprenyl-6-methoxyphenol hydroxylase-like FAD-dependent oxidoreductase